MGRRTVYLFALTAMVASCSRGKDYDWRDSSLPTERRVESLVSELTLEEKASLVLNSSPAIERLGIREYNWWSEALHGVARNGYATVFPQPVGMASSFDPELVEKVFEAVSDEARVKNREAVQSGTVEQYQGLTFWTPNVNILRDPRWGRGMETYGEDPFLTGTMGVAAVRGLQGPEDSPVRKLDACAKHFAVHSGPESKRHYFDADVSERDLRETYLPAFKDLVTKAGVRQVMTAYNRFRGTPCAVSDYLVNDILRGEWGYDGLVVSDCWALPDLYEEGHHEIVDSEVLAAAMAVHNGLDVECGNTFMNIPEAVGTGLLDEKDLDRNLRRVLSERFRLGEIDGKSPWDNLDPSIVGGEHGRSLALEMARESIVLLQNRGGILPLAPGTKIALVGPNADDAEMMWGNYNGTPLESVTLLEALTKENPDLVYVRGCGIMDSRYKPEPDENILVFKNLSRDQLAQIGQQYGVGVEDLMNFVRREEELPKMFSPELDIPSVLAQLEGIDVVIFAGGISPRLEGEDMPVDLPGFKGGDRTDIELPELQRCLLKALHDAGKKIVLVNFSGNAVGLVPETNTCDAIIQAWYPGQEGGTALAEILYGKVNPSGKLPVTFYRDVRQLPDMDDYNMKGHTYRFFEGEPLFHFGYGLSYTSFSYGEARIKGKKLIIPLKNEGQCKGTEVVQLYVRKVGDSGGPIKTLRGFRRVEISPGETVEVSFPLDKELFTWWDERKGDTVPLGGEYELLYGSSSDSKDLRWMEYRFRAQLPSLAK